MANTKATPAVSQVSDNPIVLIKYDPENALPILAQNATKVLALVRSATITNIKQLESASQILGDAEIRADEIEVFAASLREKVQHAASRFQQIPGFEDFEVTLTIRKWGLKSLLSDAIRNLKNHRAKFLSDEAEKARMAQLAAQAAQDRINKKAADDAAAAAKKAGADKATVAEIKQAVLATPAPIVESKAANVAEAQNVSLRYNYTAQITDLSRFLAYAIANKVMLNTLAVATPELEKAFRKMATDQKEQFQYPGITFKKTPVDVSR